MNLPKSPAKRQGKTRRPLELVDLALEPITQAPPTPKGLLKASHQEWVDLWRKPLATVFTAEHLPALERLFILKDERRRAYKGVRASADAGGGRLVKGSRGQMVLNPLLRYIGELDGEIRQLEDRFGLTPRAGFTLGIQFGEAARSLQNLNDGMETDDPGEDDPRLAEVVEPPQDG